MTCFAMYAQFNTKQLVMHAESLNGLLRKLNQLTEFHHYLMGPTIFAQSTSSIVPMKESNYWLKPKQGVEEMNKQVRM